MQFTNRAAFFCRTAGCNCADCKELSRFLENPTLQTVRLPLSEARRRHLHGVIDSKGLDTTHVTQRYGRPYTLVLTKTQASHERALQAYQRDLDHLEKVSKLSAAIAEKAMPAEPQLQGSHHGKAKTKAHRGPKKGPA